MNEELRKQIYLQELSESIDQMTASAAGFASFQTEQKLWDCTLADELPDETSGADQPGG